MILQVPFGDFARTVLRELDGAKVAYVCLHQGQTLATASAPGKPLVACVADLPLDQMKSRLVASGLEVSDGRWTSDLMLDHEVENLAEIYVAGVAYKTEAGPPGLWLDAYPSQPTQVQVLKNMYEELIETGEMAEVSFEEFVRLSEANVVIAKPSEICSFITQNEAPEKRVG